MKHLIWIWAMVVMTTTGNALAEPPAGTILKEMKTGMEFVWVPSGCFMMGSNEGESFEKPVHRVCLRGFWLGKYEVTQAQYLRVMGSNPSDFLGPARPVDQVSWDDAKNFADAMSYLIGLNFSLPSEAQWEYACRAGYQDVTYCGEGAPSALAWYGSNSDDMTHPVGMLLGNAWRLFDMSGNVWEWTQDCWNTDYQNAPTDGSAWMAGNCNRRVARGGAYDIKQPTLIRAAKRGRGDRTYRLNVVGFRLAIPQR
jgi:formylglycine-generating enzyme required for sulfatase activity